VRLHYVTEGQLVKEGNHGPFLTGA
jgi:hypothetical protein